jgi:hypothetical protein
LYVLLSHFGPFFLSTHILPFFIEEEEKKFIQNLNLTEIHTETTRKEGERKFTTIVITDKVMKIISLTPFSELSFPRFLLTQLLNFSIPTTSKPLPLPCPYPSSYFFYYTVSLH